MLKDTQQQKQFKVLLIGDICQDVYVFGDVNRISPEAPVPVLKKSRKERRRGMSGNVHENLLQMSKNTKVEFFCNNINNIKKIRFIDEKSNYQIMRYDIENAITSFNVVNVPDENYDAIIMSDYNKGFLKETTIEEIFAKFKGTQIFVDSKRRNIKSFKNCIMKLNEKESKEAFNKNENTEIITTLGQKGCNFRGKQFNTNKVVVHDVCGAGDVFLASLVVRWLETKDLELAIKTANRCAALSVTKLGCYTVSREEYENLCV